MFKKNKNIKEATSLESIRTGTQVDAIKQDFINNLSYVQGKFPPIASMNDYYMALAYTVRDRLMSRWTKTAKTYLEKASRTVCYLSADVNFHVKLTPLEHKVASKIDPSNYLNLLLRFQ